MTDTQREFDVVLFGAYGFTGRLVFDYLMQNYPPGGALKWAIAGRSKPKLEQLLQEDAAGEEAPAMLLADGNDKASLLQLVASTKVVVTTVGPYAKRGSKLVAACVETGTHYCDLSGEPQWMRQMIDEHQSSAVASGARIVHSCGFDSIPSDFGVWYLQRHAVQHLGRVCPRITLLVKAMKGGASGGTVASGLNSMSEAKRDREVARILVDPYSLNPADQRSGPDGRDQTGVVYHDKCHTWTAPFIMAVINGKIVRRTNALLDYPYGREFRYGEAVMTGGGLRGWLKAAAMTLGIGAFMLGQSFDLTRRLIIARIVPQPGEGPDAERREKGFFNLLLVGEFADGQTIRARVTGDRDPGYGSTSKMLAECAVCLAKDPINVGGGFWTPVSALSDHLYERLVKNAGLEFSILT